MGVKYDVIFKDGQRLSREAVCFGSMAGAQWSFGNSGLTNRNPNEQSLVQFYTVNNIHPIWQLDDFNGNCREWTDRNNVAKCRRDANRKYLTEMKLLLDDLPWLQDVITVHPLVGVVRAHIKEHKADKVITSLFLMRNLCNYGETAASYRHFRNLGYRPRLCAIMAHYVTKNFGFGGRCEFSQQYLGEYNWINPQTFGKESFMRMMAADKDTEFDFIQLPWATQRGYRRDGFYRYRNDIDMQRPATEEDFNPEEGGWKIFDSRYISAENWNYERGEAINPRSNRTRSTASYLFTRNLVDCYSIPGDTAFDSGMTWDPVFGIQVINRGSTVPSPDAVNSLLAEIERVCTEAGISIRTE